jgi:hypothetical protein
MPKTLVLSETDCDVLRRMMEKEWIGFSRSNGDDDDYNRLMSIYRDLYEISGFGAWTAVGGEQDSQRTSRQRDEEVSPRKPSVMPKLRVRDSGKSLRRKAKVVSKRR